MKKKLIDKSTQTHCYNTRKRTESNASQVDQKTMSPQSNNNPPILHEILSQDIKKFVQQIDQYHQENQTIFEDLIKQIEMITIQTISGSKLEVFGSHATGLNLPHSDIDLVIRCKNINSFFLNDLLTLLDSQISSLPFIEETKCLLSASMPVIKIKCTQQYLHKKMDISIQDANHNGINCVSLVKDFIQAYPQLRPLTLVLKQFLHFSQLSDPYQGGLSSYGLILMIVSFLQVKQTNHLYLYVQLKLQQNKNLPSQGQILCDFLTFYGMELDYIGKSIYAYHPSKKPELQSVFFDLSNFMYYPQQSLTILDPLNKKNNVGRPTYNIQKLKLSFTCGLGALMSQNDSCKKPLKKFFKSAQNTQYSFQSEALNIYKPYRDSFHQNLMLRPPQIPFQKPM